MAKHKNKPVAERKKVTDIEKALNDAVALGNKFKKR